MEELDIPNKIESMFLNIEDLGREINYLGDFYDEPEGISNREYFHDVLYEDYFEMYKIILKLFNTQKNCFSQTPYFSSRVRKNNF